MKLNGNIIHNNKMIILVRDSTDIHELIRVIEDKYNLEINRFRRFNSEEGWPEYINILIIFNNKVPEPIMSFEEYRYLEFPNTACSTHNFGQFIYERLFKKG